MTYEAGSTAVPMKCESVTMRLSSFAHRPAPASHPYVAEVSYDPVYHDRLERLVEERDELKLLGVDMSSPDLWTAFVACASDAVQDRVEQWG